MQPGSPHTRTPLHTLLRRPARLEAAERPPRIAIVRHRRGGAARTEGPGGCRRRQWRRLQPGMQLPTRDSGKVMGKNK